MDKSASYITSTLLDQDARRSTIFDNAPDVRRLNVDELDYAQVISSSTPALDKEDKTGDGSEAPAADGTDAADDIYNDVTQTAPEDDNEAPAEPVVLRICFCGHYTEVSAFIFNTKYYKVQENG